MRKSVLLGLFLAVLLVAATGCSKKKVAAAPPLPPPTPSAPAPTVTLAATPNAIERGQTTTLKWSSSNADALQLEPGLGSVPASGAMSVSPYESMTYRIVARGRGGNAEADARVAVSPRPEQPVASNGLSDKELAELFAREMHDIHFAYDKADIAGEATAVLQENADFLRKYPKLRVVVEGHCDERGSAEYNIGLGDRRATSVRNYLVSLGIDTARLRMISYGKEKPLCTESNESCWSRNRRAHFTLAD